MLARIKNRLQRNNKTSLGETSTEDLIINEPSQYIEQLRLIIADKQTKLSEIALKMNKSVEELESNIDLMKTRLVGLEEVKQRLEQELVKNNELLQSDKTELTSKNEELLKEKERIELELSDKLEKISELEKSISEKEEEWNSKKREFNFKLKQFQDDQLLPFFNELEDVMELTNSKINSVNDRLKDYIIGDYSQFGSYDPFLNIKEKINNKELFNNYGEIKTENNESDESDESDESGVSDEIYDDETDSE
jgi:hypothetical protein